MAPVAEAAELGLRDYGRILWRRKIIVVLIAVVAVAASVAYDARKVPIYQSTAGLLLTTSVPSVVTSANGGNAALVDAPTAVNVIESQTTRAAAAKLLKLPSIPSASASEAGTTDVVNISVTSTSPAYAAKVANAYANAYITSQQAQAVNSLLDAASQISARINDLQGQIYGLQTQINAVVAQEPVNPATVRGGSATPAPTAAQTAQIAALTGQQTTVSDQQSVFKQQLAQLQVNANLTNGGGQLVTPATASSTPVSPHKTRDALLALVVGLVLGIGLALLRDLQDDRIRSEDDLRRAVGGLPSLALIPQLEDWKDRKTTKLVTLSAPASAAAEAYRTMRTAIQFMALDEPIHYLMVTSPVASDGKTTTLANLGVTMAQAGQRVVAVCCDLRRPRLHDFFGVDNDLGLTSVLLGEAELVDALQSVPDQEGLYVLAAGPVPPNPAELLSARATINVMEKLAYTFDIVLIDTPPVLPVTDASIIAARCDALLLVASANRTNRRDAARAVEVLSRVDAPIVGLVVNNVPQGNADAYYYGSRYHYRDHGETRERGPNAKAVRDAGNITVSNATTPTTSSGNGNGSRRAADDSRRAELLRWFADND